MADHLSPEGRSRVMAAIRSKNTKPELALRAMLRDAGSSLRAIADGLTRDGIPTAQGGQAWHASTVRKVLASQQADAVLKSVGSR